MIAAHTCSSNKRIKELLLQSVQKVTASTAKYLLFADLVEQHLHSDFVNNIVSLSQSPCEAIAASS